MEPTNYSDYGNLFSSKFKTDRGPDFSGNVPLSPAICAYIMKKVKDGETPFIQVSIWEKHGPSAGKYYGATIKEAWFKNAQPAAQPKPEEDDLSDVPF